MVGRELAWLLAAWFHDRVRRVDYVILYVADLERAIRFYRDAIGLSFKFQESGYAEFLTEGTRFGLFERARLPGLIGREATEGGPAGEVVFLVDDVDREAEPPHALGTTPLAGPVDRHPLLPGRTARPPRSAMCA